jgi:hypothetical protein
MDRKIGKDGSILVKVFYEKDPYHPYGLELYLNQKEIDDGMVPYQSEAYPSEETRERWFNQYS